MCRADLDSISGLSGRVDVQEKVLMKIAQQIDVLQNQLLEDEQVVDALSTQGSGQVTPILQHSVSSKKMSSEIR